MNVLVTGATGVIGHQAVPRLLQAGHDVAGVARSDAGAGWLRAVGTKPVQVDLLDPAVVRGAVANANAVVHLATAIPPLSQMRRPGAWQTNDRLRTHATRNLVDAAIAAGAEVFVRAAGWEPRYPSVAAGWPTVGHRASAIRRTTWAASKCLMPPLQRPPAPKPGMSYSRSPGERRRWASRARASAAEAP